MASVDQSINQDRFLDCYRGSQGRINHTAYLRLCKVFVVLEALKRNRISLEGMRVFDYAFGSGTFFRYCPKTAHLAGVEIDSISVAEVVRALRSLGFSSLDLQTIDLESWQSHPLLIKQHDVIVCSHVLEHLNDPVELLRALRDSLAPGGVLVAIVPINEIRANPHHVQIANRARLEAWIKEANLHMVNYFECDRIGWLLQPLLASEKGLWHLAARAASLAVGMPFALLGPRSWRLEEIVMRILHVPPSQACAILETK